jgi:hypothetical protein
VEVNVSEEHSVSIFRAEVAMLGSGEIYIGLEEGKAKEVGPPIPIIATTALKIQTICFSETLVIFTAVKTSNLTIC